MTPQFDVAVIGAGAAGMMCAIEAAKRGRRVIVADHAQAAGEKIRISGGGRCNFTNIHSTPANFISANPRFCTSALARFTPKDFIARVEKRGIAYHEKTLGQQFCDGSSTQIVRMLQDDMQAAGAALWLETSVSRVEKTKDGFALATARGRVECKSLVIATGGLSIPKMGATGFGYDIARQFGIGIIPTRAGLVPLTFDADMLALAKSLSGVAVEKTRISHGKTAFQEALLFTHRGLSGPAVLQISSYWREGDAIEIDLCPPANIYEDLRRKRQDKNKSMLRTAVAETLPRRLAEDIVARLGIDAPLPDVSDAKLRAVADAVHRWRVLPAGTEGYRTAEVTLGGVDTAALSSKTMECARVAGLYFIGEVVDVTGHLGGHNFQWAWASGWCAGQHA